MLEGPYSFMSNKSENQISSIDLIIVLFYLLGFRRCGTDFIDE